MARMRVTLPWMGENRSSGMHRENHLQTFWEGRSVLDLIVDDVAAPKVICG